MPYSVQSVFNTLIQYEEYGVFVEVFKAWCECSQTDGERFKASLDLWLPHDWNPVYRAEMVEAFGQIQVHQVRVKSDFDSTPLQPIPEGVCMCVAAMLQQGTRELHVFGELAAPHVVADVFRRSQLQSVTLGEAARQHEDLGYSERVSYGTLAEGLARCPTLARVELRHGDLKSLQHSVIRFSRHLNGPRDESVAIITACTTVARARKSAPNAFNPPALDRPCDSEIMFVQFRIGSEGFNVWCTTKEKVKDFVDSYRIKNKISDDFKIFLLVGGKDVYADYGRHQNPFEKTVANSVEYLIDFLRMPEYEHVQMLILPIANRRTPAPLFES